MSEESFPCCYLSPLLLVLFPQTLKTVHFFQQLHCHFSILTLDEINLDFLWISLEISMFAKLTLLPFMFEFHSDSSLPPGAHCWPRFHRELFCKPQVTNSLAHPNTSSGCCFVAAPPCRWYIYFVISYEAKLQNGSLDNYLYSCINALDKFLQNCSVSQLVWWKLCSISSQLHSEGGF